VAARPDETDDRSRTAEPSQHGVFVRDTSADLRRSLRPVAWVVLEELALAAVEVDGLFVAAASARAVAAHLNLDPATVASALRALRARGLVELTRAPGLSGRFGLSVYRLLHLPGVEVLAPCGDPPPVGTPRAEEPHVVSGKARGKQRARARPASDDGGQGTLDLRLGRR
jgi:hypothetical protein